MEYIYKDKLNPTKEERVAKKEKARWMRSKTSPPERKLMIFPVEN